MIKTFGKPVLQLIKRSFINNGECIFIKINDSFVPIYKKNTNWYHYTDLKKEIEITNETNLFWPFFISENNQNYKLSLTEQCLSLFTEEKYLTGFYAQLDNWTDELWTISKLNVPVVGGWCTHYNVLSKIIEVGPLIDTKNLKWSIKVESYFESGTLTHSTSIYQMCQFNQKNLLKSLQE